MNATNYSATAGRLSDSQRISRVFFGAALLAATMFAPVNPLGWLAVAALIAILPITTAVFGVCPVYRLFSGSPTAVVDQAETSAELSVAAQVELGVIGAMLVGSVYVIPFEQLGGFATFALMGLLPLLVALMGSDPVMAARLSMRARVPIAYCALDEAARPKPADVLTLHTFQDAGREAGSARRDRAA